MTKSLQGMFEEDAFIQTPNVEGLDKLAQLVLKQRTLEQEIEEINMTLAEKTHALRVVSEEEIPNLFLELGIQEFKLEDGSKVQVKPYYSASITPENADKCFAWLREHGLDDVIKHNIQVQFGRGEDQDCENLKRELAALNVNYTEKVSVHTQTLKALVKEQMELLSENLDDENKFPVDLFKVYVGKKTKIIKARR